MDTIVLSALFIRMNSRYVSNSRLRYRLSKLFDSQRQMNIMSNLVMFFALNSTLLIMVFIFTKYSFVSPIPFLSPRFIRALRAIWPAIIAVGLKVSFIVGGDFGTCTVRGLAEALHG